MVLFIERKCSESGGHSQALLRKSTENDYVAARSAIHPALPFVYSARSARRSLLLDAHSARSATYLEQLIAPFRALGEEVSTAFRSFVAFRDLLGAAIGPSGALGDMV